MSSPSNSRSPKQAGSPKPTDATAAADTKPQEDKVKNHVRVSVKTNKFLYVDIVKYLLNEGETHVDVSGLAASITPVVEIIEILKSQGLVKVTKLETSRAVEGRGRPVDRLMVRVVKNAGFQKIFDEQQAAKAARDAEAGKEPKEAKAKPAAKPAAK
jgi:hypothetical protein